MARFPSWWSGLSPSGASLHLLWGIDDLWVDADSTYYVVDYKATAKAEPVMTLPDWAGGYRRQAEIYQWLLRKNGLRVSNTAYFVYCTGITHEMVLIIGCILIPMLSLTRAAMHG